MSNSEHTIQRIATAIADQQTVDWAHEAETNEDLGRELTHLRLIQSIRDVHREILAQTETKLPFTWGPLRVLEKIGEGSFGEVFRAHDPALKKDVALKLARPVSSSNLVHQLRFIEEAQRLATVDHPNVLRVYGAALHDDRVGLWTEMIDGETLEVGLESRGTLSDDEATNVGLHLCQALAAVHAAGLVHRDVKTANVMRREGGGIVLLDFSSAVGSLIPASGEGEVAGTPLFMAPELFQGQDSGPQADIYSLGVLLFRLVSGHCPVEVNTDSVADLRTKHERGERLHLRDLRPDLDADFIAVVEKALAVDLDERFRSAGEMEKALRQLQPCYRPRRWWEEPAALVGTATIVLAISTYFLWPTPFDVDGSLFRVRGDVESTLTDAGQIRQYDGLYFSLTGSEDAYVYVVSEDDHGTRAVLFPTANPAEATPLSANELHRIPEDSPWPVDDATGVDRLLFIVADRPLPEVASFLAGFESKSGTDAEPRPVPKRRTRGIKPSAPASAPPSPTKATKLTELKQLVMRLDEQDAAEIWHREYHLRHEPAGDQ